MAAKKKKKKGPFAEGGAREKRRKGLSHLKLSVLRSNAVKLAKIIKEKEAMGGK